MRKRMDGWRRIGVAGLIGAVALVALGDRGQTQATGGGGIDPLEILNLQVRSNAIIVMDSSGSMDEEAGAGSNTLSGDTRFSKLYQAKRVLSEVIAANETKVSFQFGRYTQPFAGMTLRQGPLAGDPPDDPTRFHYTTTNTLSPTMTVNTIVDLRSYVVPAAQTLRLREPAGTGAVTYNIAIAPGPLPGTRYATGVQLANEIQTQMNLVSANDYTVTYRADHRFQIARASGTNSFDLRWSGATTPLRNELGFGNNDQNNATNYLAPFTAQGDIDFLRSNGTGGNSDNPTDGTTQYFRAFSRRFFNGQVMSLLPDGRVCNVVNGTPGTAELFNPNNPTAVPHPPCPTCTVPPYTSLPPVAPHIILETKADCLPATPVTRTIRMEFGGPNGWLGATGNPTCAGFESLVPLQPCTNVAQFSLISAHLWPEVRIQTDGTIAGYTETVAGDIASQPTPGGIRASGNTPLAETLEDFKRIWGSSGISPLPPGPIDLPAPPGPTVWSGIAGMTPKPRTFAIIVTDGDDTCSEDDRIATASDNLALRAAHRAQLLYAPIVAGEPASSVTTFVVAFGSGVAPDRANWIAWGGSGMVRAPATGTGDATQWPVWPGATQAARDAAAAAARAACTTCIDAFIAADPQELIDALQQAIDQGASTGTFSDQQSITESVFELAATIPPQTPPSPPASPQPPPDAKNPDSRYDASVPVLLQSTFEMPDFRGHLRAFMNDGSPTPLLLWDAGQELVDRVLPPPALPWTRTFAQICGSVPVAPGAATACANASDPNFASLAATVLKRRIYSTNRNGVFLTGTDDVIVGNLITPRFTPPGQIALWPPSPTIDPVYTTPGPLDVAMGIRCVSGAPVPPPVPPATTPVACGKTFAALQTEFGACTASVPANLPALCQAPTPVATRLEFAIKEARQIILAHAAGANLVKAGVSAQRMPTTAPICPAPGNCLQFTPRNWLMAESTLAASAVVTPPLQASSVQHNAEYKLFRDGPRNLAGVARPGLASGFGLRNPDLDSQPATSGLDPVLKPVMSVIYHGTNHMVHAFRAGYQGTTPAPNGNCNTTECGGEELWAFVPFDQLSKLGERVKPQKRNPHTFVVATPIRVTDIFVPGNFSATVGGVGVSGTGVWRTVIMFGRGIAGKHLTTIDITAPGRFNELALATAPPIVMWSRGNPDTTLGFPTIGTPAGNTYNNSHPTAGPTDFAAYSGMGQTWSTPAITAVTAAQNTTARRPAGAEFVAFTGSGYGAAVDGTVITTEGTTIYTLDMQTGDVVRSADILDRSGFNGYENALVAPAAAFNPDQLRPGSVVNPAATPSTRVYIPDIHGRIWRLLTDSSAAPLLFADAWKNNSFQPFGNAVALVNYEGTQAMPKPHIFAESGNERRIFAPPAATPPFKMYGLRDDDLGSDPNTGDAVDGPATLLFTIDFPDGFRGTAQPATAFNDPDPNVPNDESARVFFAGTRFNPPNTPNAPLPTSTSPCRSSFDSILFAVGAETGGAAYDLNASGDDRSITLRDQRINSVRVSGGRLVVDTGLSAQNAPPPPAPPAVRPPADDLLANVLMGPPLNPDGTSRIPGLVTYKVNSSVCR